jgi:acetyl/propionyl-CoA carboxylase alpha subunit
MFDKILIANRGEIACRVIRTARALGYRTVAVYSDRRCRRRMCAGRRGRAHRPRTGGRVLPAHRRLARRLHGAPGADAVHPGYGFLSENAAFAQACLDAGLVFIGPPPAAITAMGDKALAKRRMLAAGVPCAPGYLGEDQSDDTLLQAEARSWAARCWSRRWPAAAGAACAWCASPRTARRLAGARREADQRLRRRHADAGAADRHGRHIEIQVFADAHGNAVHLGERDCTAQRRRQKVIEEAPSPVVSPRCARPWAATRWPPRWPWATGARARSSSSSMQQGRHYFLEMNTRLQVEHPVTECITGLDLVEWQLRVAAGRAAAAGAGRGALHGHAIEVRLYAEDPYDGFAPQTGARAALAPEQELAAAPGHPGMRLARCASAGRRRRSRPYYDAMVAKLIAHGRDRDRRHPPPARRAGRCAAARPAPQRALPARPARPPAFRDGADAHHADRRVAAEGEPLLQRRQPDADAWGLAAAMRWRAGRAAPGQPRQRGWGHAGARWCWQRQRARARAPAGARAACRWRLEGARSTPCAGRDRRLCWRQGWRVRRADRRVARSRCTGRDGAFAFAEPSPFPQNDPADDPRKPALPGGRRGAPSRCSRATAVSAGQPLVCVEAMKMEMWLHAGAAGTRDRPCTCSRPAGCRRRVLVRTRHGGRGRRMTAETWTRPSSPARSPAC